MDAGVKAKWLEALRSGKYIQGVKSLHALHPETGDSCFCCLGVLCEVMGVEKKLVRHVSGEYDIFVYGVSEQSALLPGEAVELAGLSSRDDDLDVCHLINMNDGLNKSFHEIADYIEANL